MDTYRMSTLEREMYNTVSHNAALFLTEGTKRLFDSKGELVDPLRVDDFVLAVSNIQVAMELSIRAYILSCKGIKPLLYKNDEGKSEAELRTLYENKKLKVQEFEKISNQLMGLDYQDLKMTKGQRDLMTSFQTYRNKLLHFACPIDDNELHELRDNLLMYCINTVMYLLYDKYSEKLPPEYFSELTGWDFFKTLHFNKAYQKAIKDVAKKSGNTILVCPLCDCEAYSLEEELCYCCGFYGDYLHRTDCEMCGKKNTVIYDVGANFVGHPHLYQGFCQFCEEKNAIFECPECHQAYHYYFYDSSTKCDEGRCMNK